ncbi:MAG: dimethylsulfonioproprionate lyase family protein [Pseudomonadota bacterium]
MQLEALFLGLAEALNSELEIEAQGARALLAAASKATYEGEGIPLPQPFLDVMSAENALPVCDLIKDLSLPWLPPQTSPDPAYLALSAIKVHVELLGPGGLVQDDNVRLGLYGILPNSEYGIRTHPAEEVFVMLAGEAGWKRGEADFQVHGPGERSHHPSMLQHATRTYDKAFMSVYVWAGDISTENYKYQGAT